MERYHLCLKKDKRLLVLLAFGVLILVSDVNLFAKAIFPSNKHIWIELRTPEKKLFRAKAPDNSVDIHMQGRLASFFETKNILVENLGQGTNKFNRERVLALRQHGQKNHFEAAAVSPRTAFFLGMPFSINNAAVTDLTLIQGIGPVLAEKIIAYRETHGLIANASQLENIPGIGPKKKEKLQNHCVFTNDRK